MANVPGQGGNQTPPSKAQSGSEKFQFSIAILMISASVVLFSVSAFVVTDNEDAKPALIASTFGNIVAAIVGYYFGQRPVQDIKNDLRQTEGKNQQLRSTIVNNDEI